MGAAMTKPPVPPKPDNDSLHQMAEEIFALAVLNWRQRLASKQDPNVAELSESQYLTLDILMRSATTPTVGEIQKNIRVLPAQMSRIIRSLETAFDKPLIHCQLNQNDKRRIDVAATDEGRRIYEDFRAARLSKTRKILQFLSGEDQAEFVRICRRIRELQEAAGKDAGTDDRGDLPES
jgi:DNA-binding MarR family transcriptional regulator